MSRTSDEKIALMKQYWRDGYSIPEIASMVSSSKATVRKYLSHDIEVWKDEHQQAKERRAKAELVPEPIVVLGTTDKVTEPEQTLTDSDFMTLIDYEFSQAHDFESVKDVYEDYKEQAKANITRVDYFREIYEKALGSLNKKSDYVNTSQSNRETNTNSDISIESDSSLSNKDIIKQYKQTFGVYIPVARKANEWSDDRLKEHICWWAIKATQGQKAAQQWLESEPDESVKDQYLNNFKIDNSVKA